MVLARRREKWARGTETGEGWVEIGEQEKEQIQAGGGGRAPRTGVQETEKKYCEWNFYGRLDVGGSHLTKIQPPKFTILSRVIQANHP